MMREWTIEQWMGKVHAGDCVAGLEQVPAGSVHLAFADPPFNIGYKYDAYDDRLDSEKYVAWSGRWMRELYRVLCRDGAFWLAIGDEYAAELKLEAERVGFETRSWVVWYYTFGVHCTNKFTRSHAHLFYFVKDPKAFKFDVRSIAVPSARQLVYNDTRANPHGRTPDDTWILRPQDCADGLTPDEDTWYFPRVNGTFKERAGFHGCQMPEQLLGRIIRCCSAPHDIVIDPFSGSCTTLVVAKKLGRRFFGFELSQEYVHLGTQRLESVVAGDRLEGADEPKVSAPTTGSPKGRRPGKAAAPPATRLIAERQIESGLESEAAGILDAFATSNRGFSVDRMIIDPLLNEDFQMRCDCLSVPGTAAERNRFLFRLRKSGRIKQLGITTTRRTSIDWSHMEPFIFASEIAWKRMSSLYAASSLDELFCDPRLAKGFDELAMRYSPGYGALEYRWAALRLRKERSNGWDRANRLSNEVLGMRRFRADEGIPLDRIAKQPFEHQAGVYALRRVSGDYVYAGETSDLRLRMDVQFSRTAHNVWRQEADGNGELEIVFLGVESIADARLARQFKLLNWYKPALNMDDQLAA